MTEQTGHKAMTEIRRLRLEAEAYTADAPEEDDFWAQERARAAAERGQQADPSACGTCRDRAAAGGQVKHDECAQRALLLPAPDAPGYELITGMTEEEVWALPARFHIPVFMESSTPKAWVCAVCWGDGWSTLWPCKTAVDHGLRVFTADDYAETAAKKQAAELAELRSRAARYHTAWRRARTRALAAGSAADRYAGWHRSGQTALRDTLEALLVMQMERDEARQELGRVRANRDYWRDRYRTESRTTWSSEVPPGGEVCADCGEPVESEPCREHNPAAVAEQLRIELAKYVGAEPTIAEEMAYLSRCIDSVLEICEIWEKRSSQWGPGKPAWIAEVRQAAEGLVERTTYPPALPWAQLMDDEDLWDFLAELAGVAVGRSVVPSAQDALSEVEDTIARHRVIAEAQHAHNTAPGPDTKAATS